MIKTETWHGPQREMAVSGKVEAIVQAMAIAPLAMVVILQDELGKLIKVLRGNKSVAKEPNYNPYP